MIQKILLGKVTMSDWNIVIVEYQATWSKNFLGIAMNSNTSGLVHRLLSMTHNQIRVRHGRDQNISFWSDPGRFTP